MFVRCFVWICSVRCCVDCFILVIGDVIIIIVIVVCSISVYISIVVM